MDGVMKRKREREREREKEKEGKEKGHGQDTGHRTHRTGPGRASEGNQAKDSALAPTPPAQKTREKILLLSGRKQTRQTETRGTHTHTHTHTCAYTFAHTNAPSMVWSGLANGAERAVAMSLALGREPPGLGGTRMCTRGASALLVVDYDFNPAQLLLFFLLLFLLLSFAGGVA